MDLNGLTATEQKAAVANIHAAGMTVNGWARTRKFKKDTVKNVLYRGWGRGFVGPVAQTIIAKLREEGLA